MGSPMEGMLRESVDRVARLVQAELAQLLSEAARGPIDLAHPQFSVVASGVAKAVASVTSSYREAALAVILPHIEVDSGISGSDGQGLASSVDLRTGSGHTQHQSQPLQVLSSVDETGMNGAPVLRAQSSAGRLLAQCTQEGLEGMMTLPVDGDDVDGLPNPNALLSATPASGDAVSQALHGVSAADAHSRASSADVLLKLPASANAPARAMAAANGGTRSLSSTGRVGVAGKDGAAGSSNLLRSSIPDRAGPDGQGLAGTSGPLDLQSLQQGLPSVTAGTRASLTSLSSPSGGQQETVFTSQLSGNAQAGQWGGSNMGLDALLRQQQMLQHAGSGGNTSQPNSQQLNQLQEGDQPDYFKSMHAALSAANVYMTGQQGQMQQNVGATGSSGNSGSAQRLLQLQQNADGSLQVADHAGGAGSNGMMLANNAGNSQQLLLIPAQQAGQGGAGGTTYVTVDSAGNVTSLTQQQNALLQQQLQQQAHQQQAAVQAQQQQQQQQQQLQALQAQLQQQLQAEAAWNQHQGGGKQMQSIPLEIALQQQRAGGQGVTLQIDPNTNTVYTTTGPSGGQQVLFTNTGEAIVVDSLGNQYTTSQDQFPMFGQQIDVQNNGYGGLGLNASVLGGGSHHLINLGPASNQQLHTTPLGLQATALGADGSHSEPLPILVGVNPNAMVQQHGLNSMGHSGTLTAASISAGSLTGRQQGLMTAGGMTLAGTRTSLTGLVAGGQLGVRQLGVALAGAPPSPLITRPQDLPGRFKVLPAVVQQRILALCRTNPVISVRDFDDKVVSKLSLLVDSWGVDQALAMLDHLEHRMRTKQGAMKNGPGYLDVAVCSHLDMLKAQGACPKSMKLEDYAAQVLAPPVYHELCEAVTNNRWLAWEHFDQGIIQLVKKLPVESAVEKLQEITYHSFKNVDNIKGCIMSILNSKIREDRRRQ